MSSYNNAYAIQNYWLGRAHGGAAAVNPPARDLVAEREAADAVAIAASLTYKPQILDLKQRLVACRAVREALREALIQVAPDHPLVNPVANNPHLQDIGREAGETVKHWNDDVV
jgi:hypothetical protein